MSELEPQAPRTYTPGQIINGHIFTEDRRWVPLAQPQHYQPQPQVIVQQGKPTNHAFHLIMTILTLGLWAPVWIIVAVAKR